MPHSYEVGKENIVAWIKNSFPQGATCLDVGPCDGKWHDLLGDWLAMDAVEIFEPNIEQHHLRNKYRKVIHGDIADCSYQYYDLIIFGDVIEHMDVAKAQHVLDYAWPRCAEMIIAVPYLYEQDEMYGNPYEKHVQPDLTPEVFDERYPGFRYLYRADDADGNHVYGYYAKDHAYRPTFSIICPTHNGAERLKESLQTVFMQVYPDYELIVVCDSCTDNSDEVATSFNARVVYTDCQRDGLARNAGLDVARGDWILFIDDDDRFMHEYVLSDLHRTILYSIEPDTSVIDFSFVHQAFGKYHCQSPEWRYCTVWARAWRRTFMDGKRFNGLAYGSDAKFFERYVLNNPECKTSYMNELMYYYTMRKGSLSNMPEDKQIKSQLDIIVTHHDEPWEICKPFFDMIQHQRSVDMRLVNIILVQDGEENALDWTNLLYDYSYNIDITTISHVGTPEARNAGLDRARSPWVMFCDIDDRLCDVCSLSMIMNLIPNNTCDIIWGHYVIEMIWRKGEPYLQTVKEQNFTNTTMKLYSKQFLDDKNIRFNTLIPSMYEYAFNAVCLAETPPHRIKTLRTEFYPYMKIYRKNSLRCSESFYLNAGRHLFGADVWIASELKKRGYKYDAYQFMIRALCVAYYSICNPETGDDRSIDKDSVLGLLKNNIDGIESVSQADREVLMDESLTVMMNYIQKLYNEFRREYYLKNDALSFREWIELLQDGKEHVPAKPETVKSERVPHPVNKNAPSSRVVVFCGTANVYENMVTSCKSVLCNLPVDKVYFLTEDDVFPYELPDIVECINVKDQKYFNPDGPNFDNAWTYMCMMRAAFPEMFPQYDRILSLDIDIIFNDNVSDLWDYDISDYYLAGVPEKQRQKTEEDPLYINFGVVLMNLDKLRQDHKQEEIITALNVNKIDCPEQTAYNEACAYHILELPPEFNTTIYSHITKKTEKERIYHYAGQTFWKHYSNVKKYAELDWPTVMSRQNALKGVN